MATTQEFFVIEYTNRTQNFPDHTLYSTFKDALEVVLDDIDKNKWYTKWNKDKTTCFVSDGEYDVEIHKVFLK
jgi:hypothetical protein